MGRLVGWVLRPLWGEGYLGRAYRLHPTSMSIFITTTTDPSGGTLASTNALRSITSTFSAVHWPDVLARGAWRPNVEKLHSFLAAS